MKSRIIICISILGFLAAIILTNINEIQNKEYVDAGTQQVKDQLEQDGAVTLFVNLPVNGWPDEPICSSNYIVYIFNTAVKVGGRSIC
jgi:hypothetical protein